ncbi:MAG: ATP-binding protein, partial [Paracoccaceae bacterium]|nr:ATP-binding protein [Paracoccaceae bacterium]
DWLRQIIGGIIGNAVRYAGAGATLRLHSGTDSGWAIIEICDNGPGLPATDQATTPLRFANGAQPPAGSFGIGLALARWVIAAHDGRLTLISPVAEGRGFLARIALPLMEAGAAQPRLFKVQA